MNVRFFVGEDEISDGGEGEAENWANGVYELEESRRGWGGGW